MPSTPVRRLAAVLAVAIVAVTGAVVVSASSSSTDPPAAAEPSELLAGIPERRGVLGDPDAPITLTEFVDLQCPVCAAAARDVLPTLITDYVRPGKVKLDARVLSFLGPDSIEAALWADAAREQDRLWPFLEAFFARQGIENSGYVDESFLTEVAETAGIDAEAAQRHAGSAQAALGDADAEAQRLGVTGTPTFVIGDRIVPTADLFEELER